MTQDKDICFTLCAGLGILGCVAFLIFVAYHVWQTWPDTSHNKTYPETQRQTGKIGPKYDNAVPDVPPYLMPLPKSNAVLPHRGSCMKHTRWRYGRDRIW